MHWGDVCPPSRSYSHAQSEREFERVLRESFAKEARKELLKLPRYAPLIEHYRLEDEKSELARQQKLRDAAEGRK